jgi:hypothetical protein
LLLNFIVIIFFNFQITVRLANGKILLAEEDYVDYYHNIVTLKVKSDAKLRPLDIYSPLENLEGVEVVALERDFYTCKLSENCGLFCKDYPYFGCELLASSTCGGNQVSTSFCAIILYICYID